MNSIVSWLHNDDGHDGKTNDDDDTGDASFRYFDRPKIDLGFSGFYPLRLAFNSGLPPPS